MMRRLFAAALALLLATAAPTSHAWLIGKPVASYTGPGDYASFTFWYGLRAYSAAVAATGTQKSINIKRDSDSSTTDVLILTDGTLDVASASTFCAATTCRVEKIYDQVAGNACGGASCDVIVGGHVTHPTLVFNCNGSLPCVERYGTGAAQNSQFASANNFTPAGNDRSFSAVAEQVTGDASINSARIITLNTDSYIDLASATTWSMSTCVAATTVNVWHASNGARATATTAVHNLDGVETNCSALAVNNTAGPPTIILAGAFSNTGRANRFAEAGMQDNALWSGAVRTNLCHNQRLYWSTGGSC